MFYEDMETFIQLSIRLGLCYSKLWPVEEYVQGLVLPLCKFCNSERNYSLLVLCPKSCISGIRRHEFMHDKYIIV